MRSILRRMVGGTACGGAVLSLFVVALTGLIVGAPLTARAQDAGQDVTITFANRTASSIELVSDPALLSFESLEKLPNDTSDWVSCSFQTMGGGNANIAEDLQYFTPACNVSNQGLWRATFTATRDFTFTSATFTIFLFSNGGGGMEGARNVKYSLTVGDVTAEKLQECAASPVTTNLTITFENAVSVKAGDTLTLNGLKSSGNYTTNSGFTQIVLGGVSMEGGEPELSPNAVWTVRPTLTGRTLDQAVAGSFSVLLNGLQRVGAAPSRVPETVPLQSVTVGLSNSANANNANAKHLVLLDGEDKIVAISDAAVGTLAAAPVSVTYPFTETEVPYGARMKGVFVSDTADLTVGGDAPAATVNVGVRLFLLEDVAEETPLYLIAANGTSYYGWAPNMAFVLGKGALPTLTETEVQPWPALNSGSTSWANWKTLHLRLNGLVPMSEAAQPMPWPNEVSLRAITFRWANSASGDQTTASLRRLVVVDSSGVALALSQPCEPPQWGTTTTFTFDTAVTFQTSADYVVYGVDGDTLPVLGDTFDTAQALTLRTLMWDPANKGKTGCYCDIGANRDHVAQMTVTVDAPVEKQTVGPDTSTERQWGGWGFFVVKMGALLGEKAPERVDLHAASVFWVAGDGGDNTSVSRLVLTTGTGRVVAVSAPSVPTPRAADMTTTFTFPSAPTLTTDVSYKGYFVSADQVPQVGATLTSGLTARYSVYADTAIANDFYVSGQQGRWAPAIAFAVTESEPLASPAININFDTDANRLAAGTDYGVVPYPGAQWNTLTQASNNGADVTATVTETTGEQVAVAYRSRGFGTSVGRVSDSKLFDVQLQDENNRTDHPAVTISGIPYLSYDIYLYMGTNADSGYNKNGPVRLTDAKGNTTTYTMAAGATEASVGDTAWGDLTLNPDTMAIGRNVMVIKDITGDQVTLNTIRIASSARGNLAAVQIVGHPFEGTMWTGTVSGAAAATTLQVTDGFTMTSLANVSPEDMVTLTVAADATLTMDAAVTLTSLVVEGTGTLTLAGDNALKASTVSIRSGTLALAAAGTLDAESVTVSAEGVFQPADGACALPLAGDGAVKIAQNTTVTLTNPENAYAGGTVVEGTLNWAGATLGTGTVTVNAGGTFDLKGASCAQNVTLNGGRFANTGTEPSALPQSVASVNFNSELGKVADDATGGLQEMLGTLWTNTTGASGDAALSFVEASAIGDATAQGSSIEGASVAWTAGAWQYDVNTTPYLVGYLDDVLSDNDFERSITVNMPANVAAEGYDVYLYFNSDNPKDHGTNYDDHFSAVGVRAGEGDAATYYTYVDGALTTTNEISAATGWGSIQGGLSTVDEGTNVMVLRHRSEPTLQMSVHAGGTDTNNPHLGPRGSIAAIQIVTKTGALPPVYSGTLTVTEAGTLAAAAGITFSGALAGEGALEQSGAVTFAEATAPGTVTLQVGADDTVTFGAGNDLSGLTLNAGADATVSVVDDVTALTLAGLAGDANLDLNAVTTLTLTGRSATEALEHTGTLTNTTEALTLVKQGAAAQALNLEGLAVSLDGQGGTLTANTPKRIGTLETHGGAVEANTSVDYTVMEAGAVNMAAAQTATAARPAAATADAATVSNFTLVEDGEIRYLTAADLDKWLPVGFLVAGNTYKVVLSPDLADTEHFPLRFEVLGAPEVVTFEVYRLNADNTLTHCPTIAVDGNDILVPSASDLLGNVGALGDALHHYAFTGDVADSGTASANLNADGAAYTDVNIDNGRALSGGTPYNTGLRFNENGDSWTLGLYLNVAETATKATLLNLGTENGVHTVGSIFLTTGETRDTLTLLRKTTDEAPSGGTVNGYTPLGSSIDLGMGGADVWHHVLITHSATAYRVYVDGEEVMAALGDFPERATGIQIGKGITNPNPTGYTGGAGTFLLDDLAIWPKMARDAQIDEALQLVTKQWRTRSAGTPADLFGTTGTWTDTKGASAVWPTTNADTYTARATLTRSATVEAVFAALDGFTARRTILAGETLTHAVTTDTPLEPPASAGIVVVDNDLTLDLSALPFEVFTQAFTETGAPLVTNITWRGGITLKNAPEDYGFTVETRADGLWLKGTRPNTVFDTAVSINFRSGVGTPGDADAAGLVPMLGPYWTKSPNAASGSATLNLYPYESIAVPGAQPTDDQITMEWTTGGTWDDGSNPVSYLKGYLDDNGSEQRLTMTVPEAVAAQGYDVYIYSSVDATGGSNFSARDVTGDDGVKTSYSYVNGVLTAGSTAGWGNAATGRTTVAEGVNVMVLRDRTDRSLLINFPKRNGRGGLAAIQVVTKRPGDTYARDIAPTGETWVKDAGWTKVNDGTTADAPAENCKAILGITGDTALAMGDTTSVTLSELEVMGEGTLTLTYDSAAVVAAAGEATTYTLLDADIDTSKVRVRMTPTDDGSLVAVTTTATGATATIVKPMGTIYRAEAAGETAWANITWTPEGTPGAGDTAILTLTDDAVLTGNATVGMLQVYGNGHAVVRDNGITAGAWHFVNDTTLVLREGDELPATIATQPKRVRYDYPYTQDYTISAAHETEFAAGFTGNLNCNANGLVEFSSGEVAITQIPNVAVAGNSPTIIFSGDARLTMTGTGNPDGLKIGAGTVIFRDNARATLTRIHMRAENSVVGTLTLEDEASIAITGTSNVNGNTNSVQFADWGGVATVNLRDNATFIADGAIAMLAGDNNGTNGNLMTLNIADTALMRVKGLATKGPASAVVNLNGGTLNLGASAFYQYDADSSVLTLNCDGGALGAWEDVTLGADAAAACLVSGTPILAPALDVTLTLAQGTNLFLTATEATIRGAGTVRNELATLPSLTVEEGTLTNAVAAQVAGLRLLGGHLTFDGGTLTIYDRFVADVGTTISLPLIASNNGGHPIMGDNALLPDLSTTRFNLVLDRNRDPEEGLIDEVPLFIGPYDDEEVRIGGVLLTNNVNGAITEVTPKHMVGAAGMGLYAELSGAAVTEPHEQNLSYTIEQNRANIYPYWVFIAPQKDSTLTVAAGGVAFRHVEFEGMRAKIVAQGTEPHALIQAQSFATSTDLLFDLTAWSAALETFLQGAVLDVPASLCLVNAGMSVPESVRFTVEGVPSVAGVETTIVHTPTGVYLVATSERRAHTVSVNFSTRANPLSAPPSMPGAYALPVGAWNDLQDTTFSATLKLSDLGGGAGTQALRGAGETAQPTQINAFAAGTVTDADAGIAMLKTWLTDGAATDLRLSAVPFDRYRLALIFANDLEGAAYAPITVGGDVYTMDSAGYTRKNLTGHGTIVPADTAWGTTDTPATLEPFVAGKNVLLTDVLETPSVTLSFPAFTYGVTYAGLAAIQVIEAPEPTSAAAGAAYTATLDRSGTFALADLTLTVDGVETAWANSPDNTLTLNLADDTTVTLTLPTDFMAERLEVRTAGTGAGTALTLQVENDGGAVLGTLQAAAALEALTLDFDCSNVVYAAHAKTTTFNKGFANVDADGVAQEYTIAAGETLILGADSGIRTNLDPDTGTSSLRIATASPGVFRRNYPVTYTANQVDAAYQGMTWAFRDLTFAVGTIGRLSPDLLIEDGDVLDSSTQALWFSDNSKSYTITQTGGRLTVGTTAGDRGFLIGANTGVPVALNYNLSGGRFETSQIHSWIDGSALTLNVTGDGVLAISNGRGNDANSTGAFSTNGANARLAVTFSENGTLEPLAATVGQRGDGTKNIAFNGGNIIFGADTPGTVDMSLSASFAGANTVDPGAYGTLLLSGANTGDGTIDLPRGTLAIANAAALGDTTVNVASGAAFESRGFTGDSEGSGEEARTIPVTAIKIDIPAGVGASDGTAIQEFCLYQGDSPVAWPRGTTISGTGRNNTPTWATDGNERINALIDSVKGADATRQDVTFTNPEDGSTGVYSGEWVAVKSNKWYPAANNTGTGSATITLGGDGLVFDSYTFWCSDQQGRFPSAWTVSVRYEGEEAWTVISNPTNATRPTANTESEKYPVTLRTEGGSTTADAVTGTVVFAEQAQCRAVRKSGVMGYPYVARIAGSLVLPTGGKEAVRFFLDGAEYDAADVEVDAAAGTVTFPNEGAIRPVSTLTWIANQQSGIWADGVGAADGPWTPGEPFVNGSSVTFDDSTVEDATVTVQGAPAPASMTINAETRGYTFAAGDAAARLDLSALPVEPEVVLGGDTADNADDDLSVRRIPLGTVNVYDVPIQTGAANRGFYADGSTIRLAGSLSSDGKTATLVGTGNLNAVGESPHGAWHRSDAPIFLTPRAGERQILSAYSAHLAGMGDVEIRGQVAEDGTVSGGTVEFAGTIATSGPTNNNAFGGTFHISDGATLDFTMTRGEGGDNPFFMDSDGTPLYKGDTVGFRIRNGGVLRFSGCRGVLGGWGQISNAANYATLWTSQPIEIGYRSALECLYGSGTYWQHTPYGLLFNGDGATLTVDDGSAAGLGLDFVRGATLTVAGIGDPGDPADPKVDADAAGETFGTLTAGITATIRTVPGASVRIYGDGGQDDALFLDVREGSTLRVDADLGSTTPDGTNQSDGAPFVKQGSGRMTLEWPVCANLVEIEVEEGALGGSSVLTNGSSTVAVASAATIEAGLTLPALTLENGATVAIDPTGATQLRVGTLELVVGGTYAVTALPGIDIPEAANRDPVKVISWTSAPLAAAVAFAPGADLVEKGYGLEIRDDGLYLKRVVTYYRDLTGLDAAAEINYQLLWEENAWYTDPADPQYGPFNPDADEAVEVVFVVPSGLTILPTVSVVLSGEVDFASIRFASRDADTGAFTTLNGTLNYVYSLGTITPPTDRETLIFDWLPTLIVTQPTGAAPRVATLSADVPPGCSYATGDNGTSVIVYRQSDVQAININFAGGTTGHFTTITPNAAPIGVEPFSGVYWTNIQPGVTGSRVAVTATGHTVYTTPATVAGAQTTEGTEVRANVTYAYKGGATTLPSRGGDPQSRLAAAYLPSGSGNIDAGGFTAHTVGNAGWGVIVEDIPFQVCDLFLYFTANVDGAVTYPAVTVKVGNETVRTYTYRDGWTTLSDNNETWAGQGLSNEGFVDGVNFLRLRLVLDSSERIQIVPCDGGNDQTGRVGLAALQIVACSDDEPAYYLFNGTNWSDATGWTTNSDSRPRPWSDATVGSPHAVRLAPTLRTVNADRAVTFPYLRLTGLQGDLTLTGEPGALATGGLDLLDLSATSTSTLTFEEDLFATDTPAILLGSATYVFPESDSGTVTNTWRWLYRTDSAHSATFRKVKAGDLRFTRTVDNNLEIEQGTLWLTSVSSNATTDYPYTITGAGTFGWSGANAATLRVKIDNRPDGASGADNAPFRVDSGTLTLNVYQGSSFPRDRVFIAEGTGTLQFNRQNGLQSQHKNATGMVFLARDGGTIHYNGGGTSNLFDNRNVAGLATMPSVELRNGRLMETLWNDGNNGSVHDVFTVTSSGLSRFHIASAATNPWAHRALMLRGGRLVVEDGALAITSSLDDFTASRNSILIKAYAETTELYGDDPATTQNGYIDVATGAALFCHYPIAPGHADASNYDPSGATLVKVGGGVWWQTLNICQSVGYNGGGITDSGGTSPYGNVEIREGTFRMNGATIFGQPTGATAERSITVKDGARIDGVGDIGAQFTLTIEEGATLADGLPDNRGWIGSYGSWNANWAQNRAFPNNFVQNVTGQQPEQCIHILDDATLRFESGSIFEVNMGRVTGAERFLLTTDADATVSMTGTLTVRLTNMPLSIAEPVRLTNFGKNFASNNPTIVCPEAVAMDATVAYCTESEANGGTAGADEIKNLWLIPSGTSYRWTKETGNWSDAAWAMGDATDLTIPDGNLNDAIKEPEHSPTARVEAATGTIAPTVDDPTPGTDSDQHTFWGAYGLILASDGTIEIGQGGTLTEDTSAVPSTVTGDLYGLEFGTTFWKIGAGTATLNAPLRAHDRDTTVTVNAGTLRLRHPLLVRPLNSGSKANDFTGTLSIVKGATLNLAFTPTPLEETYFANTFTNASAKEQILSGTLLGEGTLALEGAEGTTATLTNTNDSGVNFTIGKGNTLILRPTSPILGAASSARTAEIGPGATLRLVGETALGSAPWTFALADGALIDTQSAAHLRGTFNLNTAGTATVGSASADIDDSMTFNVAAGGTLSLAGDVGADEAVLAGATLIKRGAGTLSIDGRFSPGLPMVVEAGTLCLGSSVSVEGQGGRDSDWVVRQGATLVLEGDLSMARTGEVQVEAGATLRVPTTSVTLATTYGQGVSTRVNGGAIIRLGDGESLPTTGGNGRLHFEGNTTVTGTVELIVDALPTNLTGGTERLITFTEAYQGNGTFALGGDNAGALAEAGWTLRVTSTAVELVPFGENGLYTWDPADGTTTAWAGALNWVADGTNARTAWPEDASDTLSVSLPDLSRVDGTPIAARTLDWEGDAQTLGGLRADNQTWDEATSTGGDYLLRGDSGLTIAGPLIKTNTGALTFERAVSLTGTTGAINLFGGTLAFRNGLTASAADVTLRGEDSTLIIGEGFTTLSGTFHGDGAGHLRKDGTGTLTIRSALGDTFADIAVRAGTLNLTANDQAPILTPTFTLTEGATLALGGTLTTGGTIRPTFSDDTAGALLRWEGSAGATPDTAATLGALGKAIGTLTYAPTAGHLILDPESLDDGATLVLHGNSSGQSAEASALWLGEGASDDGELVLAGLTAAEGTVIGVEPRATNFQNGQWGTTRAITLALDGNASGGPTFMGSGAPAITAGLTIRRGPNATETPTFVYTGTSTDANLGALTAGSDARVELNERAVWDGPATAVPGSTLAGAGTLGDVDVPAGAILGATRRSGDTLEPAVLTIAGELTLREGSILEVAAVVEPDSGITNISLINANSTDEGLTLEPPTVGDEVRIIVRLTADDAAAVNNRQILAWRNISGTTSLGGTVQVQDADGNWVDSQEYRLLKKGDGLYLQRVSGRFWMILR